MCGVTVVTFQLRPTYDIEILVKGCIWSLQFRLFVDVSRAP